MRSKHKTVYIQHINGRLYYRCPNPGCCNESITRTFLRCTECGSRITWTRRKVNGVSVVTDQ